MILRDPVHGLVAFEGDHGRVVERLLATREVQRLRRVRQLGLTSFVFPGAEHSRFAHALGAAHVMGRFLERVHAVQDALPPEQRLDGEAERDAIAAALLHDLGHGPFSHLFEEVAVDSPHHESWTVAIIRDPTTEVHRALESLSAGMAERVAGLIEGRYRLEYLARGVSGAFDVDRADYLLRDSLQTGVRYGLYDLDWLLRALTLAELEEQGRVHHVLAIEGRKGLPPIESFFLGRHFMFHQVYHHKATRAAEALIRALFTRVAVLVRGGSVPPGIPAAFADAATGAEVELHDYLELDDARLLSAFSVWRAEGEPGLADLSARVLERRLPKTLPLPEPDPEHTEEELLPVWQEAFARARDVASHRGRLPGEEDTLVQLDTPADVPYPEPEAGTQGLWVAIRHRPLQRLGDTSFLLRELRNKRIVRPRLVFPASIREAVEDAVSPVLAGLG